MSTSIINDWKNNRYKSIYWLEGPEDFFIDEIINYAETSILSKEEASFNLTVFYGKDAEWTAVLNTCRAYPMMGSRQVVVIKEAQQMRDIRKLEPYMDSPNKQTILVIGFKGKTIDKRTKMAKAIKNDGELFTTKKLYENQLPAWTNSYVQLQGLTITPGALTLLVNHVGNDLSRITNEIHKLAINVAKQGKITEEDIEKYIGISKDYNIFELQEALSFRNHAKVLSIIQYMKGNPKSLPFQKTLASLQGYFIKLMQVYQIKNKSDNVFRDFFYNNPVAIKQAKAALKNYSFLEMEEAILLLQRYNLKSLGIGSYNTDDDSLMKELMVKIME